MKNKENNDIKKLIVSVDFTPILEPIMDILSGIEEFEEFKHTKAMHDLVFIFALIVALEKHVKDKDKVFSILRRLICVN